jgi:tRNA (guanine-N7-)-methyltransferase
MSPAEPQRRPVRSYVLRAGRMGSGQQRALTELAPRLVLPFEEHPLDSSAVFARAAPLVVEIGFGMGRATAAIAAETPGTNFLGIEVHEPGVGALLQRIDQEQLSNLRIVRHDAVEVLTSMIAPGSLAGVHVFFPDPWPKKRHWKRRLIQAPFVALVASRLVAGPIPSGLYEAPTSWPTTQLACNVVYELATLAGYLALTRAWSATGLELTSRSSRLLYRLGALAVAATLVGPEVVDRFPAAMHGDYLAIADVITDLLDAAVLVVAAPVLRAALTLGGGLVAWPWFLLTLSVFAWLGYDAAVLGTSLGLTAEVARQLQEAARSLATLSIFSAGVAQRWVMLDRAAGG